MELDCRSQEIPIEEPLEVVVEQEVAVETSPVVQIDEPETISGYHGNTQDTGSHQQSSDKCAIARCLDSKKTQVQLSITDPVVTCLDGDKDCKESYKRLRDRMKKQILRQDTEYRRKECVKAKERMASRRNDPAYREMERQRDRERRAKSRRDTAVRQRERERDRQYKQKKHKMLYLNQKPEECADNSEDRSVHILVQNTDNSGDQSVHVVDQNKETDMDYEKVQVTDLEKELRHCRNDSEQEMVNIVKHCGNDSEQEVVNIVRHCGIDSEHEVMNIVRHCRNDSEHEVVNIVRDCGNSSEQEVVNIVRDCGNSSEQEVVNIVRVCGSEIKGGELFCDERTVTEVPSSWSEQLVQIGGVQVKLINLASDRETVQVCDKYRDDTDESLKT